VHSDLFNDEEDIKYDDINFSAFYSPSNLTMDYKHKNHNFILPKKGLFMYKNIHKTLSEKFVSKFNERLQKEIDLYKYKENQMVLFRNEQIKQSKIIYFKIIHQKENEFIEGLKVLSDDIDKISLNVLEDTDKENKILGNSDSKNTNNSIIQNFKLPKSSSELFLTKELNRKIPSYNNVFTPEPTNKIIKNKHLFRVSSDKNMKIDFLRTSHRKNPSLEDLNNTQFSPVKIKFPRIINNVNILPVKVNNLTKRLNVELARISRSYGKISSMNRFKSNPITQYHFDNQNYYAYRTSKITETKDIFRAKLKPLKLVKDPGIEKMANSIFNLRRNLTKSLRDLVK